MSLLNFPGFFSNDPVSEHLRNAAQGRIGGGNQVRFAGLQAEQAARRAQARAGSSPSLAAREGARVQDTALARAGAIQQQRQDQARDRAIDILERRRQESNAMGQRVLGGLLQTGGSLLGTALGGGAGGQAGGAIGGMLGSSFQDPNRIAPGQVAQQPGVQGLRETRDDRLSGLAPTMPQTQTSQLPQGLQPARPMAAVDADVGQALAGGGSARQTQQGVQQAIAGPARPPNQEPGIMTERQGGTVPGLVPTPAQPQQRAVDQLPFDFGNLGQVLQMPPFIFGR